MQELLSRTEEYERSVVLFDNADGTLCKRSCVCEHLVAAFVDFSHRVGSKDNFVALFVATNQPWQVDPAVLHTFRHARSLLYVGPPDAPAREAIVRLSVKGMPVAADVDYAAIAERTDRFNGADMASLCVRARLSTVSRQRASGKDEEVSQADFDAALEKVRPSVTAECLAEFDAWRARHAASSDEEGEDS
ncbi:MAG: ATP-binding protein [Candidatus Hydrogenedentes bacterium]|nr:ATP-binding protein [Candidatus Hydrogenedentota bacterium]